MAMLDPLARHDFMATVNDRKLPTMCVGLLSSHVLAE